MRLYYFWDLPGDSISRSPHQVPGISPSFLLRASCESWWCRFRLSFLCRLELGVCRRWTMCFAWSILGHTWGPVQEPGFARRGFSLLKRDNMWIDSLLRESSGKGSECFGLQMANGRTQGKREPRQRSKCPLFGQHTLDLLLIQVLHNMAIHMPLQVSHLA